MTPPPSKGPDPERLKIEGDWEDAVKRALTKRPERTPKRKGKGKPRQKRRGS